MSPKGVEHEDDAIVVDTYHMCIHQCRRKALSTQEPTPHEPPQSFGVHPSMSPKGVEHASRSSTPTPVSSVHPSMSPKGVEHRREHSRTSELPMLVHPSMSPKGVEHRWRNARPEPPVPACIHQCRRKALSTLSRSSTRSRGPIVHPSMSPKGVEHPIPATRTTVARSCASINVAERR